MKIPQPSVDVRAASTPDWAELRALASAQAGYFTTAQAGDRGFSEQLLSKHAGSGTLERRMRGIYRLPDAPTTENEDLVVAWLWSGEIATISHESALQLHGLSDAMPARVHLTVPLSERGRRRVVPESYVLHFADLAAEDAAWIGAVPVTSPARTVRDVAAAYGDASLIGQAIDQGIRRGSFHAGQISEAMGYVASFETTGWRVFPDAVADLGDTWVMHAFSGTCTRPPPSDWPTGAREAVERHGGRLYYQGHHRRSGTVSIHVAWPIPGPDPATVEALRAELAKGLGWR